MVAIIFCGCTSEEKIGVDNVDNYFEISSFQSLEKLSGEKLELGIVLAPVDLFFNDTLLFISSVGLSNNVGVYNSKDNFDKIGNIVSFGQGPN